jgi:hypothetical protein
MRKLWVIGLLVLVGLLTVAWAVSADKKTTATTATASEHKAGEHDCDKCDPELKAQTICPMCGMKYNKEIFVEKEGHRIYTCSEGCAEKVRENFDKAVKMLKEKGEKPECGHDTAAKEEQNPSKCGGCPLAGKGCGPKK